MAFLFFFLDNPLDHLTPALGFSLNGSFHMLYLVALHRLTAQLAHLPVVPTLAALLVLDPLLLGLLVLFEQILEETVDPSKSCLYLWFLEVLE